MQIDHAKNIVEPVLVSGPVSDGSEIISERGTAAWLDTGKYTRLHELPTSLIEYDLGRVPDRTRWSWSDLEGHAGERHKLSHEPLSIGIRTCHAAWCLYHDDTVPGIERRVMNERGQASHAAHRVTLVSTRTRDTLTLPDGSRKTIPGGPANYIGEAFRRLGLECDLLTGEVADVEVISTSHGEEYVIPALAPIPLPVSLECAALLLSPIVREICPDAVPEVDGLLVIDLQGFVREPGVSSGDVTTKFDLTDLLTRADVVKASESELQRLTDSSRHALHGAILLTTLGERGALICCDHRERFVPARIIETPYTIGAGDSYLAGFTAAILDRSDPIQAAEKAARFTEDVLRQRS